MGSLVRVERPLEPAELAFLAHGADPGTFGCDAAVLASLRNAIEFQIRLDRILKPPAAFGLPTNQQLYLLEVAPSFVFGFEPCFMDGSLVVGDFPSERVHIGYGCVEGRVLRNWPISYTWHGKIMPVQRITKPECPADDQVRPVYRCDWLEDALARQA